MPTTYTIEFYNNSGFDHTYAFFVAAPIKSSSGPTNYFSNVWISRYVPNGGNFTISTTDQFYAWTGQAATQIAPGVVISGGQAKPAELAVNGTGGSDYPVYEVEQVTELGNDAHNGTTNGAFSMTANGTINQSDNPLVGAAQLDNEGNMVPTFTVPAEPNLGYNFYPVITYFVAEIQSVQGTTYDENAGSLDPGKIDFTNGAGAGKYTAKTTATPSNLFNTTYQ